MLVVLKQLLLCLMGKEVEQDYIRFSNIRAAATVINPATATDKLLIAPSTSPSSIALEVPITCADVPIAIPLATGCFIPKILHNLSPIILPVSPVIIIAATVIAIYPCNSADNPIPMAVVMDFGNKVTYCVCERPNSNDIKRIATPLVITPDAIPTRIAVAFLFNNCNCS